MSYTLNTPKSWQATMRELGETMSKWGIREWDVFQQSAKSNVVTLTYVKNEATVTLSMSKQARAVDNLRVLYLAVEAMRMNEKRGLGEVIQEAYLQLAAPEKEIDPWELLGIRPDVTLDVAEAVYRTMASKYHPDAVPSGNAEKFKQIKDAIEAVRKERNG